jgi:hypothetical protein
LEGLAENDSKRRAGSSLGWKQKKHNSHSRPLSLGFCLAMDAARRFTLAFQWEPSFATFSVANESMNWQS